MRRRGFTLLEILMVSSLLLVVLALAVQILLPVLESYKKSDRRSGLLQKVAAGLDRIEAEVADANVRGLQYLVSPKPALVVQPLGAPGATGNPFWSPELRVFVCEQGQLRYHKWGSKNLNQHTIAEPYALTAEEIPAILTRPSGSLLLIGSGVEQFNVTGLEATVRKLPLKVTLSATLPSGERFQLVREISPRIHPSR